MISTAAPGAESVYATDLDGDGDADVLSASYDDDKIAWYENLHPVVTLTSADPDADEWDLDPGQFTVTRDSSSGDLTVHYSIGGTAEPEDYAETLTGSVVIGEGQTSATITITPVHDVDTVVEGDETVQLTLTPDAAYTIGTPSGGTVTIKDVLPGDANGNDVVNDSDLSLLLTSWPGPGPFTWQQGNFTSDPVVNDADLSWLLAFWERTYPPAPPADGPVGAGDVADAPLPQADAPAAPHADVQTLTAASRPAAVGTATLVSDARADSLRAPRQKTLRADGLQNAALRESTAAVQNLPARRSARQEQRRPSRLAVQVDVDLLRQVRPQVLAMDL